jgi:hypothetical protein
VSISSTGLSKHEKPGIGHNRPPNDEPDWLALKRKISVSKAAELNNMSEDTFRRRYRHLIKKVSPRRDAVELGDALAVGTPKDAA